MGMGWAWWVCLLSFLIAVLIGAKALWDSKKAPYFILREEAETRARRMALIGLALLAANVGLLLWGKIKFLSVEITPTPMSTPTSIPATPVPTLEPVPAHTVQVLTPTAQPPTPTPTGGAEASFEVLTLARGVSEENLPFEPSNVFPTGTKRVYVFFTYRGMEEGMGWAQAWYRGGEEVWSQASLWHRGSEGIAWVYVELGDGFPPGEYEVRLYIDHTLQEKVKFTVQ